MKTIQYKVYRRVNGTPWHIFDTSSYKRPSFENLTDTWSGSGVNGEIDMPTMAQLGSTEIELGFKNVNDNAYVLYGQELQEIEVRWVVDEVDPKTGKIKMVAKKDIVKFYPKGLDGGSVEVNAPNEGTLKGEAIYFKHIENGRALIEVDKLGNVFKIKGVDYAASIREAL